MKKHSAIVAAAALVLAAALINRVGAPAHAQNSGSAAPAARIAAVDTIGIVEKLMSSDRFKPARDQFNEEQKAAEARLRDEFMAIQAETQKKTEEAKSDEEKQKVQADAEPKGKALQDQYQGMQAQGEVFNTNQLADAYQLVLETAGKIARERGYTLVVASRSGDVPRDKGFQVAFQELLLRHVAVMPAGDDLTDTVIKELKIEAAPTPAPEAGPPAPAPEAPADKPAAKPDAPKKP